MIIKNLMYTLFFSVFVLFCGSHFNSSSLAAKESVGYQEPTFLPAKEAFRHSFTQSGNQIKVRFDIADGYYLYKKRFKFSLETTAAVNLSEPTFSSPGELKNDEEFGEVMVYHRHVDIDFMITPTPTTATTLVVDFQGCAEAGLCYPPAKVKYPFPLDNIASSTTLVMNDTLLSTASATSTTSTASATNRSDIKDSDTNNSDAKSSETETKPSQLDASNTQSIVNFFQDKSILFVAGMFFLLGLGLTFTPCVLPMIPILSGVIAGQHQPLTTKKGFILSSCFVLGMALTFAVAGLLVGMTGARLNIWMQNPVVLSVFGVLFILLALSMFGFYEMQLPAFIRDRLNTINHKQQGGHWLGVFIMGIMSALVVSPCVTAPFAAALIYIAQLGSPLLGFLFLLALGLGMGTPLIVIGTTGANMLPRAGAWMDGVKVFFGVMLLAVGAWIVRTLLPDIIMMVIWSGLLIIPSIYLFSIHPPISQIIIPTHLLSANDATSPFALPSHIVNHSSSGWTKFAKGIAIMMATYGIMILIGAASGQSNPLKPLAFNVPVVSTSIASTNQPAHTGLVFEKVTTLAKMQQALEDAKNNNQPVMLDYYADWCIACVEMEHDAFQSPNVKSSLKGFKLIQADLTNNPETDALLSQFKLIGPPSILFFDKQGQWLEKITLMGQMDAKKFDNYIQQQVLPKI